MNLGDIVQLKQPYKPSSYEEQCYEIILQLNVHLPPATILEIYKSWSGFTHGIIVQILNRDLDNEPTSVSLHLYNPEMGLIYLACPDNHPIPTYVVFQTQELELVKISTETGYLTEQEKHA